MSISTLEQRLAVAETKLDGFEKLVTERITYTNASLEEIRQEVAADRRYSRERFETLQGHLLSAAERLSTTIEHAVAEIRADVSRNGNRIAELKKTHSDVRLVAGVVRWIVGAALALFIWLQTNWTDLFTFFNGDP